MAYEIWGTYVHREKGHKVVVMEVIKVFRDGWKDGVLFVEKKIHPPRPNFAMDNELFNAKFVLEAKMTNPDTVFEEAQS